MKNNFLYIVIIIATSILPIKTMENDERELTQSEILSRHLQCHVQHYINQYDDDVNKTPTIRDLQILHSLKPATMLATIIPVLQNIERQERDNQKIKKS